MMLRHKDKEIAGGNTIHSIFRKLPGRRNSIRVRLTCWYTLMTSLIIFLYGGLLYSTLEKMLPPTTPVELPAILLQIILMGLGILLTTAVSGYWLAAKAMRPVQLMMQTAQHIEQTNLSQRLPVKSSDELGKLATTFNVMLSRLEKAFSQLRQFTANASHELRTPLSTITIATNRLLSQWDTPQNAEQALEAVEAYRHELAIIQAEAEQMTHIVTALLTLARVDTEQVVLAHESIDISEVILDVVERLAPLAQRYGIELSLGAISTFSVRGDRWYLASMLSNLIENGLKYSAGVGKRVHIESGIEKQGWGWIRVQDDGPGIAEKHWPHLYNRFYRVDLVRSSVEGTEKNIAATSSSGCGLGLALVAWIVQAHSGEIRLQSQVGEGSCFEVWLPTNNSLNA
jgi:signal transduction histidine kinase